MPDQCTTCGAADVLLFTCGYCDRQFCADHVRSHQSQCDVAAHTGGSDVNEEAAGFQWGKAGKRTATTADTGAAGEPPADDTESDADPFEEGGFRFEPVAGDASRPRTPTGDTAAVVERAPRAPTTGTGAAVERVPRTAASDATPAVERVPRDPSTSAIPAVRPAPRPIAEATSVVERVPWDSTGVHLRAVRRPAPRAPTGTATSAVRPATEPKSEPTTASTDVTDAATAEGTADTTSDGGAATAAADEAPVRPMDLARSPGSVNRNEPRTTMDWIRQQTYISLTVKTALLAAVINGALYFGMLVTLEGLL